MAAGAVSLRKSHDIVISSFCNIVKGQANYDIMRFSQADSTSSLALLQGHLGAVSLKKIS